MKRSATARCRCSAAGSFFASPSKATTTRKGASSRLLSRLSAPGTSASVFQDQLSDAGTRIGRGNGATKRDAAPSARAVSTARPSRVSTEYAVSRFSLDMGTWRQPASAAPKSSARGSQGATAHAPAAGTHEIRTPSASAESREGNPVASFGRTFNPR